MDLTLLKNDEKCRSYVQASHVLLFARTKKIGIEHYPRKAVVLMQMRFDGYIGFPGGLVEDEENVADGLNRELEEEIAYDCEKHGAITQHNHLFSQNDHSNCLVLHFYSKELTEEAIEEVVRNSTSARDYGSESLGVVEVPLYTMQDSYRGFPSFLCNNFIGNAKLQLTRALIQLGIMTESEVKTALEARPT